MKDFKATGSIEFVHLKVVFNAECAVLSHATLY